MMKLLFRQLFLLLLLVNFTAAAEDASGDKKWLFKLSERNFTLQEAQFLTGATEDIKSAIQANFATMATVVLCERSGIRLNAPETRRSLSDAMLLMSDQYQQQFEADLQKKSLTRQQWLDYEAARPVNQLQDAVRRWYVKKYGNENPIRTEHIRNWYHRHQNIFRRTRVNPEWVWVFDRNDDKLELALSALRQGMTPQAARKLYALPTEAEKIADLLHKAENRTVIDRDWTVINSGSCRLLLAKKALSYTYIALDEKLSQVISNVLYDALARARLAEALKKEFAEEKIVFY